MTAFVPPGWPAGVQPPGSPDFDRTAATWLLDVVPPDYLLHGVLRRHPIALAALARHHLAACVEGARNGYRMARTELGPHLSPSAIEAVLTAYRSEGSRLATAARAADLIERALHGEEFVPNMGGGARGTAPEGHGPSRRRLPDEVRNQAPGPASATARSPDRRPPGTREQRHQPPDRRAEQEPPAAEPRRRPRQASRTEPQ